MSAQLVPLTTSPNQSLTVSLLVNGRALTLNLSLSYNSVGQFWVLNIADQNNNPLVSSVPLITGYWPAGNILAPYEYLQIGQAFLINQNGASTDWPNDSDLGNGFVLLWDDNVGSGSSAGLVNVPVVPASGDWSSYPVSALENVV